MSAYDEEQLSILVAKRLGVSPSETLRFVPLIPAALLRAVERFAARADLRHHVQTNPASVTVALDSSGVADLSALITSPRIQLHLLKFGDITHASFTQPLRFLTESAHAQFADALDAIFPKCWLEGTKLKTRGAVEGVSPLSGSLSLRVPYWMTLAQAPETLVEKEGLGVADSLIELLAEEPDGDDSTDK